MADPGVEDCAAPCQSEEDAQTSWRREQSHTAIGVRVPMARTQNTHTRSCGSERTASASLLRVG
eukprot:6214814-Pleurochrysis_carterae.AAC.4